MQPGLGLVQASCFYTNRFLFVEPCRTQLFQGNPCVGINVPQGLRGVVKFLLAVLQLVFGGDFLFGDRRGWVVDASTDRTGNPFFQRSRQKSCLSL